MTISYFADIRFLGCDITLPNIIFAQTHKNEVVQIYSNSWGFGGQGNIVVSLGSMWNMALQQSMTVCIMAMTGPKTEAQYADKAAMMAWETSCCMKPA